jgi:hypothetical protein
MDCQSRGFPENTGRFSFGSLHIVWDIRGTVFENGSWVVGVSSEEMLVFKGLSGLVCNGGWSEVDGSCVWDWTSVAAGDGSV